VKTVSDKVVGHYIRAKMIGGEVPLNANFALSKQLGLYLARLPCYHELWWMLWLQWNIKLLTLFINWTNWSV